MAAAGYEVHLAEDAISAGYLLLRSRPDPIICDVNMPHMISVIFLTSLEDGAQRGKDLGAVAYVTKPVRADRLLSMVDRHIPGGALPIG